LYLGATFKLWCVTLLRISEIAERSGVPSSTLRYYERIGLVQPTGRADNGYRVYDEGTLERLAFIGRAKRLGMSLDEVAALGEAWFAGDCEPVQDRLRAFVSSRISDLRRQIVEDSAFERQLERILGRLGTGQASPNRCSPDCGCDIDPLEAAAPGDAAMLCSLSDSDAQTRLQQWRRLIGRARAVERSGDRAEVVLHHSADLIGEAARLSATETACCPFFEFNLEITAATVVLIISSSIGPGLVSEFLDLIETPTTPSISARVQPCAS
jgi:DNA-binding transcriptional MerR regulator